MLEASVPIYDSLDALDILYGLVRMNARYFENHGLIDLYGGDYLYKELKKNCAGAEPWMSYRRLIEKQANRHEEGRPYIGECELWGPILCGLYWARGKTSAEISLCRFDDGLLHVQVLYQGKIYDPSVRLGMPVPKGLEKKLYRLDFEKRITV